MNQSTTPSTPAEILARQVRMAPALRHLAGFRYRRPAGDVTPPALPISDDEVTAWVDEHPFKRGALAPHVARCLAYLERDFARKAVPA